MATRQTTQLKVGSRNLDVSNLEKVFYPKTGFTKGQVIDYYVRVSSAILPHLKNRPITLKRYPNGVDSDFFYEKRCPSHRPAWIKTSPVWSEGSQSTINFCVLNDLPSLVWAANIAVLEIHAYLSNTRDFLRPTALAFDLDPGPPADIVLCCKVALIIRDLLAQIGLQSFPKTSGSKGLQFYVPLNTPSLTYDDTKTFARGLAETLERQYPDLTTSNMRKSLRPGKVFIDWSQNDDHKTTVCAYSLRAKDEPTVSTPVTWEEVEYALKKDDASLLRFTYDQVLERVEKHGDLFAPVLKLKQKLPALE